MHEYLTNCFKCKQLFMASSFGIRTGTPTKVCASCRARAAEEENNG